MILGIIQGRLSDPKSGHQTTPDNWEEEFVKIKEIELNHLEWNIDFNKNFDNPVLHDSRIKDYSHLISSVCFDTLVTEKVFDEKYFQKQTYHHTEMILKNQINRVTFPLLEDAEISNDTKLRKIIKILSDYHKNFPSIEINLELDCSVDNVENILSEVDCQLTYDTGNLTHKKINHLLYIEKFFNRINNVHLKDRSFKTGESMSNFQGDTPFKIIFKELKKREYKKMFTLQMAREETGKELDLIKNYVRVFKEMYSV